MELCNECGEAIKENKWDLNRINGEPFCSKCYDKIEEESYLK